MKIISLLCITIVVSSLAFSQRKIVADKIVAVVGDKIILKSDIDNQISDAERQEIQLPPHPECLLMSQSLLAKMLILQAEKDSLPVTEEEVDAEVDQRIRYFISLYSSKEALEQISGRTVFQLKDDMRGPIRENKLAESMRYKIEEPVKITPTEVKEYFDQIPKDSLAFYESELEIGQIVAYPKASREMELFAQEQLAEYKRMVESGEKKFETLASLYSDDPGSKDKGGMYQLNRVDRQWDPAFRNAAFALKDEGQVSRIIKSKFGYHIIQLVTKNGDDIVIRHILKIPRITDTEMKNSYKKLDSVRAQLIAGNISFGEAVNRYSDDENSKFTAGLISGPNQSTSLTIDMLDKDLVLMLKDLQVGEYSQPVEFTDERGKKGIRIIHLLSKTEPHRENLKDDYNRIAQRALEIKKNQALEKWFYKKLQTTYVKVEDDYSNCEDVRRWLNLTAQKKSF